MRPLLLQAVAPTAEDLLPPPLTSDWKNPVMMDVFLILMIMCGLAALFFLWASVFRKSGRRVRVRRVRRPRNPTLAERGGLPRPRSEKI